MAIARRLKILEDRMDSLRAPQLGRSSIENGAVNVYDGTGQLTQVIGQQFDGTTGAVVVSGPTPPIPTGLTLRQQVGGVEATWDGTFVDPQVGFASPVHAPQDFVRVEVELSNNNSFPASGFLPKRVTIPNGASGGTVFVPWDVSGENVYARLKTRSASGLLSSASAIVGPVASGQVEIADLGFDITDYAGGSTIYYGASSPTPPALGFLVGDLWLQTTGGTGTSGQPLYLTYRWTGSAWVLLQDQGISQSLANALAAQTTANSATSLANAAQSTANAKITAFYQGTAPSSGMATGDFWVNTASGNVLSRWSGSAWVSIQDAGISSALSQVGTAQATADRKVQTFIRATAPTNPTDALGTGDIWLDSANGNRMNRWSGSAWVLAQDAAISTALANAATAQSTANGKIAVFYQGTSPSSGMQTGDLWVNTASGNALNRYNGTIWVGIQDAGISTALANAATAQTTANTKILVFAQPTTPTASEVGDIWIETDNGNAESVWGPVPTVQRTNWVVNPSMEFDAAGAITSPSGWAVATGGTTGAITTTIVASGATFGTKVAKIVGAGLTTLNTGWIGFNQTIPCAPGDLLNIQSWLSYAVTSASQRPEYLVEWLNAAGGVISSLTETTATTMGTAGSRAPYAYAPTAAPALTASARVTLRRRGTLSSGGTTVTNADLSLDAMIIERNRPTGSPTTYFDGSTTGTDFIWNGQAHLATSTAWVAGTSGANAWQPVLKRTGSFQPNSVLASNIIATGSVSATLLEAVLVLATAVVGGVANGDNARLDSQGLRLFGLDPDGQQVQTGSFGTVGIDRFTIVDPATGKTLVNVSDQGVSAPNITTDTLTVGGNTFTYLTDQLPKGTLVRGGIRATTATTTTTLATFDVEFTAVPGRQYRIHSSTINLAPSTTSTYGFVQARVRPSADGPPTISTGIGLVTANGSENVSGGVVPICLNRVAQFSELFPVGSVPTVPTKVRVLLCYGVASGGGNVSLFSDGQHPVDLYVDDAGVATGYVGSVNDGGGAGGAGGGGVIVTTQTLDFAQTWGSNWQSTSTAPRTDQQDLIQGYTPYYPSPGTEVAMIGFADMTGTLAGATINWMAIYMYANSWNSYAGGTALIGAHPYLNNPATRPADWQLNLIQSPAWPRAAGRWVYLPSSWFAGFISGANRGITLGDLASTSGEYYGRFDSYPALSRPVLRINFTK
jgi:hypothetical protein